MDSELHAVIKNQVHRDLTQFSFAPKQLHANINKIHQLMKSNNYSRKILCVSILRDGTPLFNVMGENITIDKMVYITSKPSSSLSLRFVHMMQLVQKTTELYRLEPVRFFIYISDSYCYQHRELPLFVMAKPSNRAGILIPDDSFNSWGKTSSMIHQKRYPLELKTPKMYFKGARTGVLSKVQIKHGTVITDVKWGTRCIFEKYSKTSSDMIVNLNGPQEAMHTWSKYKYLLNLPGEQPWSYRFKYLLLTGSLVIDIVLHQQYDSDTYNYNERWNNIFDVFFRHNREYVQIPFRWIEGDTKNNDLEHARVIARLEKIFTYFEKNQKEYTDMVERSQQRVKRISEDAVYHAMSVVIKEYTTAIQQSARISNTDADLGLVGVKRRAD
jgi:hypothetical protein